MPNENEFIPLLRQIFGMRPPQPSNLAVPQHQYWSGGNAEPGLEQPLVDPVEFMAAGATAPMQRLIGGLHGLNQIGAVGDIPKSLKYLDEWKHTPVEYVPIKELKKYREFDRPTNTSSYAKLKESIAKDGIQEPLKLTYYKGDRTAVLGEGNHRLKAAEELGMTEVPVEVLRYDTPRAKYYSPKEGRRFGSKVPGFGPTDENDYIPGNLYPSDIGIPVVEKRSWREK